MDEAATVRDGAARTGGRGRRPPAPVPPERPPGFWAFFRALQDNPVTAFAEDAYREPLHHRPALGSIPDVVLLAAPDLVKPVFVERMSAFDKGEVVRRRLAPMLGDGILIADEATWLPQRRVIQPLFRPRLTEGFLPDMVAAADGAAARLAALPAGAEADMTEEMNALTYDVIARTAFSGDTIEDPAAFSRAIGAYFDTLGRVDLASFLALPAWIPTLGRIRARPALALFRRQVGGIVEKRRALIAREGAAAAPKDLLTALLTAKDPKTGEPMSPERVYDNAVVFLAAGHETTSNTLQWTLFLLSEHPEWDRRVADEIAAVTGGRPPSAADLDRLPLTRMVVDEALRLYPPVPFIPRMPSADEIIDGRRIRRGSVVFAAPFVTHRHRTLWQDPDHFRPERFGPGGAVPDGAYFPFGLGPRACLGARFAIQEVLVALAALLPRFRFETVARETVFPQATITLKPKLPLRMRVLPR